MAHHGPIPKWWSRLGRQDLGDVPQLPTELHQEEVARGGGMALKIEEPLHNLCPRLASKWRPRLATFISIVRKVVECKWLG